MATTVGELNAVLRLSKRDFDQGMGEAEGRFSRFGSSAAGLAKGVAIGAGVAVAAAAVQGTKALVDFDTGLREVFTLLPGITDEARAGMEADVLAFSQSAGVIPGEVLPALYQAISAGVPSDNVFAFLETANQAAVGGITDLSTSVDGITSVVNAYGSDVISAAEASDLMFTAVKEGKTDFGQLSDSLFQVIPTAAALGVKFGDVTGALAQMTAQGTPTRVATTQLRQLFVELSKDGGKASDAFKELSGRSFADFVAAGGDVADALEIMSDGADDNGIALQDMFGSVEAGAAALALAGPNLESFRGNLAEMDASAGATDAAFGEMDAGLARSWEKIKVNAQVGILQAAQFIFDGIKKLKAFWDENWDAIKAVIDAVWGAIGPVIDSAMKLIVAIVEPILIAIKWLWENFGDEILAGLRIVWNVIVSVVEVALAILKGVIDTFTAIFEGDWSAAWDAIKDIVAVVWEGIKDVALIGWNIFTGWLAGVWTTFQEGWDTSWTAISDAVSGAFSGAVGAVKGVINGILGAVESGVNAAIRQINNVIRAYNSIPFAPDASTVPEVSIPRLHTGGRVPGPPGTDQMAMLRAGETVGRSGLGDNGQQWPRELRLILGDDQGDDLAEFMMDRGVHLLRSSQGMHT